MKPHGTGSASALRPASHRLGALLAAVFLTATAVLFWPASPANAAPSGGDLCSTQRWQDPSQWSDCVSKLQNLTTSETQCVMAPVPANPDSGNAGWFASQPTTPPSQADGLFTHYGYAGYQYNTYDIGCVPTLMHPDYKFENTVANGEFGIATAIVGASNALRDKAWNPQSMWGWADPLVQQATTAVYKRVFTVFGTITLAIVGLYLLWRSRQADMSSAMTTAGWAILVMVAVTAIAAWPVKSAHIADQSLITGLSAVHDAVGPPAQDIPAGQCAALPHPEQCKDNRTPAQRASDVAVQNILYRNWLRGELGSADSPTAQKYGQVLYDAKSFTWGEAKQAQSSSDVRDQIISRKQTQWEKVAKQIKTEDPEAYQFLQGTQGTDRMGAGFIAILSALFFAMFDITASVLVLLGFLIFRWAVIAAPILGTIGMLRPASAGLRRLVNAVVAALFNVIIFGTGAAIYLFAVDLIMSTASLPGWLQVTLVWLTGVVGWLLLRPYRRITQLGGGDSAGLIAGAGSWHRRFWRDARDTASAGPAASAERGARDKHPVVVTERSVRPETRTEDPPEVRERPEERRLPATGEPRPVQEQPERVPATAARRRLPTRDEWDDLADRSEDRPSPVVYRPASLRRETVSERPESAPVRG